MAGQEWRDSSTIPFFTIYQNLLIIPYIPDSGQRKVPMKRGVANLKFRIVWDKIV